MEKSKKIYLDNAAATPMDPKVMAVILGVLRKNFANSSATHDLGVENKKILEKARVDVAQILVAHSDEVVFTSGATESNNLAVIGILENCLQILPHIITTNIEHPSVLETCKHLEKMKRAEVTYVPVEVNGIVDPKKIKKAIKLNTILISVMYANNEIGTIQPIREIAKEIRHFNKINKKNILFHTDATQAVNYLPLNVEKLGVDMMSINGGKIYGPKGIGALYVRRKTSITKIIFGGEQELGLRPGTENLAGMVGLAEALKITENIKEIESKRLIKLRDYFIQELFKLQNKKDFNFVINGDLKERLPNNINISVPNIPSDLLVIEFSARGIYISEKSACKSGDKAQSHVIGAIRSKNVCRKEGSLRFSLGRQTTKSDIDYTLKSFSEILNKLKKWYD